MAALRADLDRYERALREQGFTRIAGVDEAGRGALAGPLVAAAVILPEDFDLEGIDDSKVLTRLQREAAYERIVDGAVAYVVRKIEPDVIDARGLHRSNIALMRRCVKALDVAPDYVLTDGFPVPRMPCLSLGIKKGDAVIGERLGRGDRRQGDPRRPDAPPPPPVRGVRLRPQQGVRHAGALGGPGPAGSHAHPPALVRRGADRSSLPGRSAAMTSCVRERMAEPMESDDIERFEEERELELYREYRDVAADVHVRDRDRAAVLPGEQGRHRAPGRRVGRRSTWPTRGSGTCSGRRGSSSSVRVMTRRDVNVEELRRREEPTTIPD